MVRWSKIAAHLPGRTDNEIKNYWRTRVQKHAKQLNCDVNSKRFKDAMRFLWMPRLAERAAAAHHHHHQPPSAAAGCSNVDDTSAALAMAIAAAPSSGCSDPSSAVTTAACSSSCSSLASFESAHDGDGVAPHAADGTLTTTAAGADDDYWVAATAATTTTAMQQQPQQQLMNDHYDFWSTASALQHVLTAGGDHHQFQHQLAAADADHELTGWVQGFSDAGGILMSGSSSDNLWSLDDIWRMH